MFQVAHPELELEVEDVEDELSPQEELELEEPEVEEFPDELEEVEEVELEEDDESSIQGRSSEEQIQLVQNCPQSFILYPRHSIENFV